MISERIGNNSLWFSVRSAFVRKPLICNEFLPIDMFTELCPERIVSDCDNDVSIRRDKRFKRCNCGVSCPQGFRRFARSKIADNGVFQDSNKTI
ncbi:hypothetical protein GBAR_LOCUS9222 [Geodia barretti]|uniref:Uncharacterized protein n=1 Tax=Geodia barretti TaxID=519541 RepID=A0AA35RPE0_GEOBA|nr:hypothetical protein GBAR_LOCUS9222 [Geodia barretti]